MITRRLYKNVAASTTETDTYTVPTNSTLEIRRVACHSGQSPDTTVYIIIDEGGGSEEIIICTHGDVSQEVEPAYEVAAGLTVKIKLVNDQGTADFIGGDWMGTLN